MTNDLGSFPPVRRIRLPGPCDHSPSDTPATAGARFFLPPPDDMPEAAAARHRAVCNALLRIRSELDASLLACVLSARATPTVAHVQELVRSTINVADATLRAWTDRIPPEERHARWRRAVSCIQRSYPYLSGATELPLHLPAHRHSADSEVPPTTPPQRPDSRQDDGRVAGVS